MILLASLVCGFSVCQLRAWFRQRALSAPQLRQPWIVVIAALPQFLAFGPTPARQQISDEYASAALAGSMALWLIFAWANRRLPGFWLLGLGLALNLLVIAINGGFMPISPETLHAIAPCREAGKSGSAWVQAKTSSSSPHRRVCVGCPTACCCPSGSPTG